MDAGPESNKKGESEEVRKEKSVSSSQKISLAEQILCSMREELSSDEISRISFSKKKIYFKILKTICKRQ